MGGGYGSGGYVSGGLANLGGGGGRLINLGSSGGAVRTTTKTVVNKVINHDIKFFLNYNFMTHTYACNYEL